MKTMINQWKVNDVIEKFDFKKETSIEFYSAKNKTEKNKAINIIKNNDMLQYHYFAQEYNVVKAASYIALLSIKHNGIKLYIGFISVSSPTRDKMLRSAYFGTKLLQHSYDDPEDLKSYVMARVVLLPSYRGLGLASYFIDEVVKFMKNTPNFMYMEMVSNMLHNYNFSGKEYNQTFIDMKYILSDEQYNRYFASMLFDENGNKKDNFKDKQNECKGYKGFSKLIGNLVFVFNENKYDFLIDLYKRLYDIEIDFNINNELTADDIMLAKELKFPLIILKHSNEKIRKLDIKLEKTQNKENKWTI